METTDTYQPPTDDDAEMTARRTEMSDGRYLIFFTFGDDRPAHEEGKENV